MACTGLDGANVLALAVRVFRPVAAGPRRRGAVLPLTWKPPGHSRFPRLCKVAPVGTSCPSSSPRLGDHGRNALVSGICLSSSQAGPATHGQTHNQQKRLVDWSFRADLESTVAAIGAWRNAWLPSGSRICADTCTPPA